jgi:hypothetical protein
MKKKSAKIFSVCVSTTLCAAMLVSLSLPGFAKGIKAESTAGEKNFIISNPYGDVNWETWGSYKTQLHCHTNASDGYQTIHESVAGHYDLDYDIVSITDHGTLNRGWNNEPQLIPLLRYIKKERTKLADIIPLTAGEYGAYLNGTAESSNRTHENGMLDVPLGIELNFATPIADCHLTGYFSEYGQGLAGVFGDYETPSAGVAKAGGISMLSHVGNFLYIGKDKSEFAGKKVDEYYVNKFSRIFLDNKGSSLGMGINSAVDSHTRCDRILYDQILAKTIPDGVTPWGFTFSDSHTPDSLNNAYTYTLMESFTLDDFRESLENGRFFSVSHFSKGIELDGIGEMPEGYVPDAGRTDTPIVTGIEVNQEDNTITVKGENFDRIVWVSNGNVILRQDGINDGTAAIDLDDYSEDVSLYVRFYITGPSGICYSQPFVTVVEGETLESVRVPKTRDISTFLRGFVTVVDFVFFKLNPVIWAFKYFALGYSVF